MKKILIINTKYRNFGGEDSNIHDEISLLSKSYDVDYIEFDNNEKFSIYDLISFFTSSNYASNKRIKQYLKQNSPDIAYIHNLWFKGNLGIFKILNYRGIKTINKIHNYRLTCSMTYSLHLHLQGSDYCYACNLSKSKFRYFNKYFNSSYLKSIFLIKFSRNYLKKINKYNVILFVLNSYHRDYLIQKGLNPKNIKILYNPLVIQKYEDIEYNSKSEFILYAGMLSEEKGINNLIDAWKKANIDGLKLKIAGTVDSSIINEENFSNPNIEFLGYVPHKKLMRIMQNSRAVITVTKLLEGQPRLLCEASSLGVPSIYPSFGGMNEYFPNKYPFAFVQYNYIDLIEKLKKLIDEDLLNIKSKEVHSHVAEKLNHECLLKTFENNIKGLEVKNL